MSVFPLGVVLFHVNNRQGPTVLPAQELCATSAHPVCSQASMPPTPSKSGRSAASKASTVSATARPRQAYPAARPGDDEVTYWSYGWPLFGWHGQFVALTWMAITLGKLTWNIMEPESGPLEDYFSLQPSGFQVPC